MKTVYIYSLKRLGAALVDYGVFFLFLFAYAMMFGVRIGDTMWQIRGYGKMFFIFFVWFMYFPVIESRLGYTLGKGLFDLKVVDQRGKRPSFSQSLKRHVVDIIDIMFFSVIILVPRKTAVDYPRRLGDLWADTRVVSEDIKLGQILPK